MSATSTPSLFGDTHAPAPGPAHDPADAGTRHARTLLDMLYDGFFMLFLLRNKQAPGTSQGAKKKAKRA